MHNVLFVLVDCLRADAVSGPGRGAVTPTIDQLISRGTYFEQSISTAVTTTTCVASLLTGEYPFVHGIRTLYGYKLNSGCVTLPEVLQKNGYHTYAMVTGPLSPLTGLNRGFDEYEYRTENVYLTDSWGESVRRKLKEGAFREPWFIFLHLWEIHRPRQVRDGYNSNRFGSDPYERAVSSLDVELERLLEVVGEDTVIVLHGDHGENREAVRQSLFYPFYRLKRRLAYSVNPRFYKIGHGFHVYDFLIRVPLLFVGRAIFPAGKVVPDQVRQIDIFPTLVEALGLEMPSAIEGRSVVPLLGDELLPELPAHVSAAGGHLQGPENWRVGIRTAAWKYVFTPQKPEIPEELYHLEVDPQEWRNLATTRRSVAQKLRQQLIEMISGTFYLTGAAADEQMSDDEKKTMEERLKQLGYL
jgi:arylsulfatase A-like enzyme